VSGGGGMPAIINFYLKEELIEGEIQREIIGYKASSQS